MTLNQDTIDAINEAHSDANDIDGFHAKQFLRELAKRGLRILAWEPIASRPTDNHSTYLVANGMGQVAPWIDGVIHNNVGTPWDWNYGEDVTHWALLPMAPALNHTAKEKETT